MDRSMPSHIDLDQLSPTQQAALQQYTSVTDQDVAASISILEKAQWNVQIAITRFFDGEVEQTEALPTATPSSSASVPGLARTASVLVDEPRVSLSRSPPARPDDAPRIVPQPHDQIMRRPPFLLTIVLMPFSILYKLASSTLGFIAYLFPFLPPLFKSNRGLGGSRPSVTSGRRMLNPKDTAARFIREFEEEYGSNDLPFYTNGYAQASDAAKRELKLLLVVLLSPEHDDTRTFVQDTLLHPEVVRFFRDPANNIILWAGNVRDSEAYQVSTALRCTKFPFTAVVSQTKDNGTQMSVVGRITGPLSSNTYIAKLKGTVSQYLAQLNELRSARAAQSFERTIRQEQDSAYERSLAQDRERARLRREREAEEAAEARLAAQEKEAADKYAADLAQWKKWRAQSIAPEPEADDKDVVRIALRMPESAERITRRFKSDTTIEELYAFVECYDVLQGGVESSGTVSEPTGFKHEYKFHLVSPMPRAVYDIDEGGSLLNRIGRSGNLIVEPINDDSDGEAA